MQGRRKPWSVIIIAVCLALGLSSASALAQTKDWKTLWGKHQRPQLYWIGKVLNNPWWVMANDFAVKEAQALGVTITCNMPEEEVNLEKQVSMFEDAIQKNVDAIIFSPVDSVALENKLKEARAKGIKLINIDTKVDNPDLVDVIISTDDELAAYKGGKYICEKLGGQGEVALLEGILSQTTHRERKAGFLKACAEYPSIKVVATAPVECRSDLALDATVNILTAHPNVRGMFASNDQEALGMVNGVRAAGGNPKELVLVGLDCIQDGLVLVQSGELQADIHIPAADEGVLGVRYAVTLLLNPALRYEQKRVNLFTARVTHIYEPGLTEKTAAQLMTEYFPLHGVTNKGY
jgi:ABC-type sugar transport system substrate-binding protein